MAFGMIEVMILLFVLIIMLIRKEVWMIGRVPMEKNSFLVEDWFLDLVRRKIAFHRVLQRQSLLQ